MKPVYHVKQARITDNFWGSRKCLLGQNVDNPNCTIGGTICTSQIVSRDDNRVETENSVYIVDSWHVDPDSTEKKPLTV